MLSSDKGVCVPHRPSTCLSRATTYTWSARPTASLRVGSSRPSTGQCRKKQNRLPSIQALQGLTEPKEGKPSLPPRHAGKKRTNSMFMCCYVNASPCSVGTHFYLLLRLRGWCIGFNLSSFVLNPDPLGAPIAAPSACCTMSTGLTRPPGSTTTSSKGSIPPHVSFFFNGFVLNEFR